MSQRWKQRPPGSNWGEFGPDDERGRMNLVTEEKVMQGVAEVKTGKRFCLSLPLDYPGGSELNPRRLPPRRFATTRAGRANFNFLLSSEDAANTDVICDDGVLLWLQYSTQWDSFAHIGSQFDADGDGVAETVFYNGWRAGEHIVGPPANQEVSSWGCFEGSEAKRLGIENMAAGCMQGRGVMIDLAAHFGRCRKAVGYDDLMRVMETDQVVVEKGDMACFYTGYADVILEMKKEVDTQKLDAAYIGLDGRDEKLLQWITDSGVAALISDNYAVELFPPRPGTGKRHPALPLHEHCLFKLGVHLGEIWYLTELAKWLRAHRRSRFLLTAPPLNLPGAVGSPASPVATV